MSTTELLQRTLDGRELLSHPFYERWRTGDLSREDLAHYAEQYRYFERQLPATLAAMVAVADTHGTADLVAANLHDELHTPRPHVELFEQFAHAFGAMDAPASDATRQLIALYADAPSRGIDFALGVLAAYEVQAAEIARTKGDALRIWFASDTATTEFWDVHAEIESDHAEWTVEALDSGDLEQFEAGARASADAWWRFLDEREELVVTNAS